MKSFARAAAALLFLAAPSHADETGRRDAVQSLLETFRTTYGFPGATAAYVLPDGSLEAFAVGMADVEAGIPMVPDSRMLAASIGKSVWGALVLSLESEGVLDRADLVADHLGDLPWFDRVPNADTMTVGHLLTHTAGIPDHVHMKGFADALIDIGNGEPFDPTDAISFILDQPPLFAPGSAWAYSDTGYLLLGLVVEAATGNGVFDLADERLLVPLGLTATGPSDRRAVSGLAVGYTVVDNPFSLAPRTMDDEGRLTWNPAIEWTGGGFVSTSADLARWGHALFTGKALEVDYLDRLLEGSPVHEDAPGVFYGAGVALYRDTPLGPVFGHGGWIPGYVSSLRHYADHGLTIAFQINADIGVVDDSTDLVPALEAALAGLLVESAPE